MTGPDRHRRLIEARARRTWGDAWALLSAEQRAGARALAALDYLAGQDEDVPAERVRAMLLDAHAHARTDDQ